MKIRILALSAILLAFGALSALALVEHGYWGIFKFQLTSSAGWQVLADLVLVCMLAILWMITDARRTGRNVWPFVLLTLIGGAFGPLLYLTLGSRSDE
tara:strand:+ start:1183 stop:1476 length:294 start_codon:yes stop_codon:yes gene_type:complete